MFKKTNCLFTITILVFYTAILSSCATREAVEETLPVEKPVAEIIKKVPPVPLQLNNSENYKFDHLGIVVKDIEKTVDVYSTLFDLKFGDIHEYQLKNVDLKGKSVSYTMKIAFAGMEPVRVELIEIVDGESLHVEFLKTKGQGIQHLGYEVSDLKTEMGHAETLGLELITYFEDYGIPVMAYYETGNGLIVELVQENVMEMIKEAQQKTMK